MRKLAISLIAAGIILTLITGFQFLTKRKIVDIGSLEITASQPHRVNWSPYLGVGMIVIGGIIFLAGKKR